MKRNTDLLLAFMLALALFFALCTGKVYAKTVNVLAEETDRKVVCLTFDDGPSSLVTPVILDILEDEQVPATFFLVGRQIEGREEIVKRMVREGHSIGIHTFTHEYEKIYASKESLLKDIELTRRKIDALTGISPKIYRFPGGSFSIREELKSAVKEQGYTYIDWNACCRDGEIKNASPDRLVQEAISTSKEKNKVILLLHDSTTHKATADALPSIISYYREQGYAFSKL
ncbi:MAG: polysaccharide deacetylase [Clostridia bacterium]|nr:polysaccharide deacetylase [Clostridia bacterium]